MSTLVAGVLAAGGPLVAEAEGDGFHAPTPEEFYQPIAHVAGITITRPMILLLVAAVLVFGWLRWATRSLSVVPSKRQFFAEGFYDFVRNGIARDMIGSKEFMRFVPLLFSLFLFILVNNLFGSFPLANFPTMSRIGMPLALVLIVYVLYHVAGIRHAGFGGYFKHMVPPGLPVYLVPLIFVLELMTFFITRPLTLTLRLFGNMFAGHMLMGVFIGGGTYLVGTGQLHMIAAGAGSFAFGMLMQGLELLIQALQAYVFTMLAASYFSGAVADEH